jgi:hypothetical protein
VADRPPPAAANRFPVQFERRRFEEGDWPKEETMPMPNQSLQPAAAMPGANEAARAAARFD